jgi:putative ABC transport system permease protein
VEHLAAQSLSPATDVVGVPIVLASLTLVVGAVVLSRALGIRVEGAVVWASARAAVQLIAVGYLLAWIFRSAVPDIWAWLWIIVMGAVTVSVLARRVRGVPGVIFPAAAAVTASTGVSLGVVFGFGVFEPEPVTLVVIAGITLGNVLPTAALAAAQGRSAVRDEPQVIEGLLGLGFDRSAVVREIAPRAARLSLLPQLERTKVVGLIALPGALTGLLLAGVDPVDAVVVQLLVMYLVLGSATVAGIVMVYSVIRAAVSPSLRLAPWVVEPGVSEGGRRRRS